MPSCRRGYSMLRMWHVIFEAAPKDQPVTLAVLDGDFFHALDSMSVQRRRQLD